MDAKDSWKLKAKQVLSERLYCRLAFLYRRIFTQWIPVGKVHFGSFSRLKPISQNWGFDRGQPIDRYYVSEFLCKHSSAIHGHVLEIGDACYTRRFGGARVVKSDVLNVKGNVQGTTIIADLADADHIPSCTFDCLIITQTLHLIYDFHGAVKTMYRILKPGGVALVTVPGITPILDEEWAANWYWSFSNVSAMRLFEQAFSRRNIFVEVYGNVLTATAFLQGLAADELKKTDLDFCDSRYPVLIGVKAKKSI